VTIASDGVQGSMLLDWIDVAVAHAESQPPKQPKRKTV
jgi:hypothetical protein